MVLKHQALTEEKRAPVFGTMGDEKLDVFM